MKRFILSLALGFSAMTTPASAWVGGPFDNGFHSAANESNSVYQAVLTMLNGSGYCYFTPDAVFSNVGASNNGGNTSQFDNRGSLRNRSVIYYKGVTYVGSALGMVDGEARYLQCSMNGTSELGLQVTNTSQQQNLFSASQQSTSVSSTIVNSNRSFTFNGNFQAKIYQTAPSLRFKGKGELIFLSPTSPDSVAGLAYQGYASLINAIVAFIAGSRVEPNVVITTLFSDAQTAIDNALAGLTPYLNTGGINSVLQNGKKQIIHVTGTRRYL